MLALRCRRRKTRPFAFALRAAFVTLFAIQRSSTCCVTFPLPYQIWRKRRLITLRAASGLMYLSPLSADIEGNCIGPF